MPERNDPECADEEAQGVVAALRRMGIGEAALGCFPLPWRLACTKRWEEHQEVDWTALAGRIWRSAIDEAVPAGIEQLHPSWIVEAVLHEPGDIVALARTALPESLHALVGGGRPPVARLSVAIAPEVVRLAWAPLASVCIGEAGPRAQALCHLSLEELLAEVTRKGACIVGQSLSRATASERARVMASVGEPWSAHVLAAAVEAASRSARPATAILVEAARLTSPRSPVERLQHVGVVALRSELRSEHPDSSAKVAGRLPAELGRVLLEATIA